MQEEQKEVMEGIWDDPEARESLQQFTRVLLDVAERFVDENISVIKSYEDEALMAAYIDAQRKRQHIKDKAPN